MTDDPVLAAVQKFMDAVEVRLVKQAEENRGLRDEVRSLLGELQTRAAALPVAGPPGPPGEKGERGERGADSTVPGPRGEKGEAGAPSSVPGQQGERGERGERGADSVIPGPKGETGERGADGINGRDGAASTVPGPQGERGERGADSIATREEIVAIVEERAADINVRTFGDVYQGVYENGKPYTRGLLVTWGGSLWLSLADTNAKPGENADWRLVVKKGADGRK